MRVRSSDLSVQEVDLLPEREALQISPYNSVFQAIQSALILPEQVVGSTQHGGLLHGGPKPLPGI
jgi:hypothetical protein